LRSRLIGALHSSSPLESSMRYCPRPCTASSWVVTSMARVPTSPVGNEARPTTAVWPAPAWRRQIGSPVSASMPVMTASFCDAPPNQLVLIRPAANRDRTMVSSRVCSNGRGFVDFLSPACLAGERIQSDEDVAVIVVQQRDDIVVTDAGQL